MEILDKEDNEIKLDIPLNVDPNETKNDETDVDKLLGNSMTNQEKCLWWVFGEINFLKEGIKDFIDTFTKNLAPHKIDKLLKLSQKIVKDIKVMKIKHEVKIDRLENEIHELKNKLKGLVEVIKEAMYNSAEGLKREWGNYYLEGADDQSWEIPIYQVGWEKLGGVGIYETFY